MNMLTIKETPNFQTYEKMLKFTVKKNAKLKCDSIQLAKTKPLLKIFYFSGDGKIGKLSYFVGRYSAHRQFENIY